MKQKSQSARTPTQLEERVLSLKLSDGVGFLVRIIDTRVRVLYEELTRQNDVTPRQFGTLLTLYQRGSLTLTELATAISVDRSTLSEMIGRMVRKRLISKVANGDDARSAKVAITPQGKAVLLRIVEGAMEQQRILIAPLPKSERARFVQNLKLIARYEE